MENRIKKEIKLLKIKITVIDSVLKANPLKDYAYLEGNKSAFKECVTYLEKLLEVDETEPLPW